MKGLIIFFIVFLFLPVHFVYSQTPTASETIGGLEKMEKEIEKKKELEERITKKKEEEDDN